MNPVTRFASVDAYLEAFPEPVRSLLQQVRDVVHAAAPQAEEVISYNMPAIRWNSVLVYYAANKAHIGFYPTASGIEAFQHELTAYKTSKGAVQFPFDQPLPADLIERIVRFRLQEVAEKVKAKAAK